jgi:hypothetical protein
MKYTLNISRQILKVYLLYTQHKKLIPLMRINSPLLCE